jgi:hypothetical protein
MNLRKGPVFLCVFLSKPNKGALSFPDFDRDFQIDWQ